MYLQVVENNIKIILKKIRVKDICKHHIRKNGKWYTISLFLFIQPSLSNSVLLSGTEEMSALLLYYSITAASILIMSIVANKNKIL